MTAALRFRMKASLSAEPDTIALYGALLEVGSDLKAAGETVYRCDLLGAAPTPHVLATAKAALRRGMEAIQAYEEQR